MATRIYFRKLPLLGRYRQVEYAKIGQETTYWRNHRQPPSLGNLQVFRFRYRISRFFVRPQPKTSLLPATLGDLLLHLSANLLFGNHIPKPPIDG